MNPPALSTIDPSDVNLILSHALTIWSDESFNLKSPPNNSTLPFMSPFVITSGSLTSMPTGTSAPVNFFKLSCPIWDLSEIQSISSTIHLSEYSNPRLLSVEVITLSTNVLTPSSNREGVISFCSSNKTIVSAIVITLIFQIYDFL